MNILVITRSPWNDSNGLGMTLNSIFQGFPKDFRFFNLCFRSGSSVANVPESRYQVTDLDILKNLLRATKPGCEILCTHEKEPSTEKENEAEKKYINFFLKKNWKIAWFLREILWDTNIWKTIELDEYIRKIKPDIVFFPVFNYCYPFKVTDYVLKKTHAKLVMYHVDDNYSMRQINGSPLFWIYRIFLRKWIKKFTAVSYKNYVISEVQKDEYKEDLGIESSILTKCADFSRAYKYITTQVEKPIKIIYTGNLHSNRWKSIALLSKALGEIVTPADVKIIVYSGTPLTKPMKKILMGNDYIDFRGSVPADEIPKVQSSADILLHVEAFDKKNSTMVHQSFSTKIVDYLHSGKCVMAIGPHDVASIMHLKKNDMALVATNADEIKEIFQKVMDDPEIIGRYAEKAFAGGQQYHDVHHFHDMLINDFEKVVNNEYCSN